jgi:hypothetical protein
MWRFKDWASAILYIFLVLPRRAYDVANQRERVMLTASVGYGGTLDVHTKGGAKMRPRKLRKEDKLKASCKVNEMTMLMDGCFSVLS